MKKTIIAIGIIALFIGTALFTGATIIGAETVEKQEGPTTYPIARIVLDGELDITGGLGWFGFPVGGGRYFVISTQFSGTVVSGTLTVKGIDRSTILNPGGTIEMNAFFGIWGPGEEDEDSLNYCSGTVIGVTPE